MTALTISPAQYAYARDLEPAAANPVYLLGDWCENGLPADSFDVVIAIESSEHMADKPAFFAEVHRVLKPGGRFVVAAWLARPSPGRLGGPPSPRADLSRGAAAGNGHGRRIHRQLAAAAGLEPVHYEDLSRQVKRTWPICAWRTIKGLIRNPDYRHFLFKEKSPDRVFALTLFRILLAYETGSMRYGILKAVKPAGAGTDDRDAVHLHAKPSDLPMSFVILGLGTALPESSLTQERAAELTSLYSDHDAEQTRRLAILYRRTGIAKRHIVLLDRADLPSSSAGQAWADDALADAAVR